MTSTAGVARMPCKACGYAHSEDSRHVFTYAHNDDTASSDLRCSTCSDFAQDPVACGLCGALSCNLCSRGTCLCGGELLASHVPAHVIAGLDNLEVRCPVPCCDAGGACRRQDLWKHVAYPYYVSEPRTSYVLYRRQFLAAGLPNFLLNGIRGDCANMRLLRRLDLVRRHGNFLLLPKRRMQRAVVSTTATAAGGDRLPGFGITDIAYCAWWVHPALHQEGWWNETRQLRLLDRPLPRDDSHVPSMKGSIATLGSEKASSYSTLTASAVQQEMVDGRACAYLFTVQDLRQEHADELEALQVYASAFFKERFGVACNFLSRGHGTREGSAVVDGASVDVPVRACVHYMNAPVFSTFHVAFEAGMFALIDNEPHRRLRSMDLADILAGLRAPSDEGGGVYPPRGQEMEWHMPRGAESLYPFIRAVSSHVRRADTPVPCTQPAKAPIRAECHTGPARGGCAAQQVSSHAWVGPDKMTVWWWRFVAMVMIAFLVGVGLAVATHSRASWQGCYYLRRVWPASLEAYVDTHPTL